MSFTISNIIQQLELTPQIFEAWLSRLPEDLVYKNEGKDTWSPYDIIGHLIHGEKTDWIPRAKIILSGSEKPFEPFDRFAQFENSKGKSMPQLLDEFAYLRSANIQELESLNITEAMFKMEGKHPALGKVTLQNLLATWVAHDLSHIHQVSRVLAFQMKKQVGPWRQYLGVLN